MVASLVSLCRVFSPVDSLIFFFYGCQVSVFAICLLSLIPLVCLSVRFVVVHFCFGFENRRATISSATNETETCASKPSSRRPSNGTARRWSPPRTTRVTSTRSSLARAARAVRETMEMGPFGSEWLKTTGPSSDMRNA